MAQSARERSQVRRDRIRRRELVVGQFPVSLGFRRKLVRLDILPESQIDDRASVRAAVAEFMERYVVGDVTTVAKFK